MCVYSIIASIRAIACRGCIAFLPHHSRHNIHLAAPSVPIQILTIPQFSGIAGDIYPAQYQVFLAKLSAVNLDLGYFISYLCVVETKFYNRLILATAGPLFIVVVLGASYRVAMRKNAGSDQAMRTVKQKHVSAIVFVAFFVYSSVSFIIFQTFVCDKLDDGENYLRANYSLTCTTKTYITYKAYAVLMVFVYPIGIPAIFFYLLSAKREHLVKLERDEIAQLQPLKSLWKPYKPSQYYFEVVECGRRIALTGVAAFILPGNAAQIAIVLLIAVVFTYTSETVSPFEKRTDMALYRWGNGVISARMYVALLLKVDVSDEDSNYISAFSSILISANVAMILAVVVQSALSVRDSRSAVDPVEMVGPVSRGTSSFFLDDVDETKEGEIEASSSSLPPFSKSAGHHDLSNSPKNS